jgi:UDP-N-acetylmuramate dehydrogenase
VFPNVGSFFKNPVLQPDQADVLRGQGDFVHWVTEEGLKFSAAQLIDRTGLKNLEQGGVVVWGRQPLVLVNLGADRGQAFLDLARHIREAVLAQYQVNLEIEPTVLGQLED